MTQMHLTMAEVDLFRMLNPEFQDNHTSAACRIAIINNAFQERVNGTVQLSGEATRSLYKKSFRVKFDSFVAQQKELVLKSSELEPR